MTGYWRPVLVCILATVAMAGLVASTTEDLGPMTAVDIPRWLQLPGIIFIGALIGFALRTARSAMIGLVVISVLGAIMQGMAIASAGFVNDAASVFLFNRGTVQGFYALLLIFFFGMVGIVCAMAINVFARRQDI